MFNISSCFTSIFFPVHTHQTSRRSHSFEVVKWNKCVSALSQTAEMVVNTINDLHISCVHHLYVCIDIQREELCESRRMWLRTLCPWTQASTNWSACFTICLYHDSVQRYACSKICLSQDLPVPISACSTIYLYHNLPVSRSAFTTILPVPVSTCPTICLSQDLPVPRSTCPNICLFHDLPVQQSTCNMICLYHDLPVSCVFNIITSLWNAHIITTRCLNTLCKLFFNCK